MAINWIKQNNFSEKEESILKKIQIKWMWPNSTTWYDIALQEFIKFDLYNEKFVLAMISKLRPKDSCSLFLSWKIWDSLMIRKDLFYKMSEKLIFDEEFLPLYKALYNYLFIQEPKSVWQQVSVTVYKDSLLRKINNVVLHIWVDFSNIQALKINEINSNNLAVNTKVDGVKSLVEELIDIGEIEEDINEEEIFEQVEEYTIPKIIKATDDEVAIKDKKPIISVKSASTSKQKLDKIKKYSEIEKFKEFYKKERSNFNHESRNIEYFVAILDKFIELEYKGNFLKTIKSRILKLDENYEFSDIQKEYLENMIKEKKVKELKKLKKIEIVKEENTWLKVLDNSLEIPKIIEESEILELLNKISQISNNEELLDILKIIKDLEINLLNELFDEIAKDFSAYHEVVIKYLLDKKGQQKDIKAIQKIITYLDTIKSDYSWWIKKFKDILWDNLLIINNITETEGIVEVIKEVTKEVEVEVVKEIIVEVMTEVEKIITINQTEEIEKDTIIYIESLNNIEELRKYFTEIIYFSSEVLSTYIKKLSELWAFKDIYKLYKIFTSKISKELYKESLLDALDIAPKSEDKIKFVRKFKWAI